MSFLGISWDKVGATIGDAASSSFNYVASGKILSDAATVAQKTGETISYIAKNPGHSAHIALEGVEQGVGSATGLVVGGLGDTFNWAARGTGNLVGQNWELYKGGFGTGIHSVNTFVTDNIDSAEKMVGISKPVIRNEYDRYILGATKGITEVGAMVALTAATAGTGAALIGADGLAVAAGVTAGSVNTVTAATLTGAGTLYAMGSDINDQIELRDATEENMKKLLPNLLDAAMPLPAGPGH